MPADNKRAAGQISVGHIWLVYLPGETGAALGMRELKTHEQQEWHRSDTSDEQITYAGVGMGSHERRISDRAAVMTPVGHIWLSDCPARSLCQRRHKQSRAGQITDRAATLASIGHIWPRTPQRGFCRCRHGQPRGHMTHRAAMLESIGYNWARDCPAEHLPRSA